MHDNYITFFNVFFINRLQFFKNRDNQQKTGVKRIKFAHLLSEKFEKHALKKIHNVI